MADGNSNTTHTVLRWVIAIAVFLIVYFLCADVMARLIAAIMGLIAGYIAYWLAGMLVDSGDSSPAQEAAAPTADPVSEPAPVAEPPAEEPTPVEEPAAPVVEEAPAAEEPAAEEAAPVEAPVVEAPAEAAGDADGPEVLSAPRGEAADDLKKIKGVGPGLEKTLNELGIYHFSQIAAWTASDIEWVDARLKFKGRITRDDWVSQAKEMAE